MQQEAKIYTIGGPRQGRYQFTLKPMTLALREQIDTLLADAGILSINDLLERMANEVASTLNQKRALRPLCELVLEFHDASAMHRWYRQLRMKLGKATPHSIIGQMQVEQQVEIFTDFFTVRLGAVILFGNSLKNMASSLAEMQKEQAKPYGTSSIS